MVFLDYNSDGRLSPGEPITKTERMALVSAARPNMSFTVLTDENTLDTSSNQILDNVILKSPQGSEVVSPLTTLMVETELDAASIVSVLGLPAGLDPTKFNPFSEEVDAAEALSVEIISHQIVTTLTAISTVFEAADVIQKLPLRSLLRLLERFYLKMTSERPYHRKVSQIVKLLILL